jgi:hypothetical protein
MGMKTTFIALTVFSALLRGGTMTLLDSDTLEIPVAQYRTVRFEVPVDMSHEASIAGSLLTTPDTASVEMILLHMDDYLRWSGDGGAVDTLAYVKTAAGSFRMDLPGLGRYALVVSSRGNYRPVMVVMELKLHYADTGSGDPLPSAMKLALLLIALGAASFAIGSVIVKLRRKT